MKVGFQRGTPCTPGVVAAFALTLGDIAGYYLRVSTDSFSVFWPSSGILLGLFLINPLRRWLPLAVISVFVELMVGIAWTGHARSVSWFGLFSAIRVAEGALIATWIRNRGVNLCIDRARDLVHWLGATAVACTLSGVAAGWAVSTFEPARPWLAEAQTWSLGNALGVLVVTPLFVCMVRPRSAPVPNPRIIEAVLATTLMAFFILGTQSALPETVDHVFELPVVLLPFLLFGAWRYGPRGISTMTVVATVLLVEAAHLGTPNGPGHAGVLSTQALLFVGAVCGFVLSATAVERRAAVREVEAHRENDERLRIFLERARDVFFELDSQGRVTFITPTIERLIGYRPEEILGRPVCATFADETSVHTARELLRRCTSGEVDDGTIEAQQRTADGRQIWWEAGFVARRNRLGQLASVIGVARDITRRKHAELALEASEQRFRSFSELVPEILWSTDPDGRFTYLSSSLSVLLGYQPEEALGRNIRIAAVTSDGKAAAEALLTGARAGQRDQAVLEIEHRHRNGKRLWCEVSAVAQRDRNGAVVAFHGVTRDVSEQRQAREQLRVQKIRLQERAAELTKVNAELDAFAQTVSHDLHAPLRHIDHAARSLQARGTRETKDSVTADVVNRIRKSATRGLTLIDDLLEFSRAERAHLEVSPVNLSAVAESVLDELRRTEPPRNVQTRVEPGIVAEANAGLARTAVRNLLANAWKFTAEIPEAEIAVSRAEAAPDRVVLAIRDNGVGFDAAGLREEIFRPFSRFHPTAGYGGHGIGLSTVERVTRRLGGRCWAESAPGQGATFFLELPGRRIAAGTAIRDGLVAD